MQRFLSCEFLFTKSFFQIECSALLQNHFLNAARFICASDIKEWMTDFCRRQSTSVLMSVAFFLVGYIQYKNCETILIKTILFAFYLDFWSRYKDCSRLTEMLALHQSTIWKDEAFEIFSDFILLFHSILQHFFVLCCIWRRCSSHGC